MQNLRVVNTGFQNFGTSNGWGAAQFAGAMQSGDMNSICAHIGQPEGCMAGMGGLQNLKVVNTGFQNFGTSKGWGAADFAGALQKGDMNSICAHIGQPEGCLAGVALLI